MAEARGGHYMDPKAFFKAIQKGQRFDIVFLRGSEDYLMRQALHDYVAKHVNASAAEFDYNEFHGSDVKAGVLWNALTTMPLLAERRMVVLELSGEPQKEIAETLARYAERPSPTTMLAVMVLLDSDRGGRAGALPPSVTEVEFKELREPERMEWIAGYAKKLKVGISIEAQRYLVETSSGSLSDLAAKLDHAALYLGEGGEITALVLMKVSGVSSEYTVFQLEEAILQRKSVLAHKIARSLVEGGEPLLRLLAMHRWTLLRLWQVSSLSRKAEGTDSAMSWADVLKRQIFKKDLYLTAAKGLGVVRIRQAVIGLLELEVRLKTGSQEPFRYYDWIWKITSESSQSQEPVLQHKS